MSFYLNGELIKEIPSNAGWVWDEKSFKHMFYMLEAVQQIFTEEHPERIDEVTLPPEWTSVSALGVTKSYDAVMLELISKTPAN